MANETYGKTLNGWQELSTSMAANSGDLPHLEAHRVRLAELLRQAQELTIQQAALMASKQEASKKILDVVLEGRKIATFLRAGVKQHYGNRAEKLVEFKMRPFRGRRRPTDAQPPTTASHPPAPAPSTGTPSGS
jgi:hypothetical protein